MMGIARTYMITIAGLLLLFYFMGILGTTPNSTFLDLLINPEAVPDSNTGIGASAFLVIEGIVALGVTIGLVLSGKGDLAAKAPFAIYLMGLTADLVILFQKVYAVMPILAILLLSPLIIYYPLAIIEWWSGQG